MSHLSNQAITIDAVLTKKGRELLARGDGSFKITQFALSDDEIDYTLYNPNHPSGSAYYGQALENMPLLEAFPDETQIMKYKLVTLPRGTAKLPILQVGYTSIILQQGASINITPQTLNYLGNTAVFESSGYTATIADARLANSFTGVGINTSEAQSLNTQPTTGTNISKTVIGTSFTIIGTTVNTIFTASGTNTLQTTVTFVGRDSGARITIPLNISRT